MNQIADQVHNQFKIFIGALPADNTLGPLADEVAQFARANRAAAKSIGVEYLESAQKLIVTLGYRTDEDYYPIRLHAVPLGKIETVDDDFAALEKAMAHAAGQLSNIICHELYVTDDHDFCMVFMTHLAQ